MINKQERANEHPLEEGPFPSLGMFAVVWFAVEAWIQTRPPVPTANDYFADIVGPRTRSGCEEAAKAEPRVDVEVCVEEANKRNWRDADKVFTWALLPPVLILMLGSVVAWTIQSFGLLQMGAARAKATGDPGGAARGQGGDLQVTQTRPIIENIAFWSRLGVIASAVWICIFVIYFVYRAEIAPPPSLTNRAGEGLLVISFVVLAIIWMVCFGVPWLGRALKRDQR